MTLIIQKFGGSSLATVDLIKKAALRVKAEYETGQQVVVVLSAMGNMTDQLVGHIRQLSTGYDRAEHDVILSAGEQISVGLMAMTLQNIGLKARSWLGWQVPIITNDTHGSANIENISSEALKTSLDHGEIAIVAGFQGISSRGRITTLGRGGSDTTAVALAAALKAKRCDIYTDVEGVYTADPRYVPKAGKLDQIAYQEMLELSTQGAKVLQRESVELAMKHCVPLRVLSSQTHKPGTIISSDNQETKSPIRGVARSELYTKIMLEDIPRQYLPQIRSTLESANISLEMPRQTLSPCGGKFDYSFATPDIDIENVKKALKKVKEALQYRKLSANKGMSKISIVGPSLSENPNLVQKLFHTLAEKGIQVGDVSTSDIKISVLISKYETDEALSVLHTAYNLDVKDT